jgi:hypothetical protein
MFLGWPMDSSLGLWREVLGMGWREIFLLLIDFLIKINKTVPAFYAGWPTWPAAVLA